MAESLNTEQPQVHLDKGVTSEVHGDTGRGAADRELLELAAKAAGMKVLSNDKHWIPGCWVWQAGGLRQGLALMGGPDLWNPLTDDGDALRLAVELDIEFYQGVNEDMPCATAGYPLAGKFSYCIEPHDYSDKFAASRRAITRAAAEIARSALAAAKDGA